MLDKYIKSYNYEDCIKKAIHNLKINELEKAATYLHEAIYQNDSSGEAHNLLGVLYEKKGEIKLAAKHYRVASDLEPTLQGANINLERVTSFKYYYSEENIDYGEEKKTYNPFYVIEYDKFNIGRLRKRK